MVALSASPVLDVVPLEGLVDEELSIAVFQLDPEQKITLRAETESADGTRWSSCANFAADYSGKVILQCDQPIGGSYDQIDRMGLIWSMSPEDGSEVIYRAPSQGMVLRLKLEIDGEIVGEKEVHRLPMRTNVKELYISDLGIVGILYTPVSDHPLPAVVTLCGGAGTSEARAQLLASHGYVTLALAYFGCEGVPRNLDNIPLEYFEKAIDWLKLRPEVDGSPIGLWGISRGGELALLLGATYPDKVQAIATYVAASVIYRSEEPNLSPWSYQGNPVLPLAPLIKEQSLDPNLGGSAQNPILSSRYFVEAMEQSSPAYEASAIPVEKIQCPLLVIAGKEDQMWPSALFAEQISQRLTTFQSPIEATIIVYENTGHRFFPPYIPVTKTTSYHPEIKRWFDFGGKCADNAFAAKDSWEETLSFFSRTLLSK